MTDLRLCLEIALDQALRVYPLSDPLVVEITNGIKREIELEKRLVEIATRPYAEQRCGGCGHPNLNCICDLMDPESQHLEDRQTMEQEMGKPEEGTAGTLAAE